MQTFIYFDVMLSYNETWPVYKHTTLWQPNLPSMQTTIASFTLALILFETLKPTQPQRNEDLFGTKIQILDFLHTYISSRLQNNSVQCTKVFDKVVTGQPGWASTIFIHMHVYLLQPSPWPSRYLQICQRAMSANTMCATPRRLCGIANANTNTVCVTCQTCVIEYCM